MPVHETAPADPLDRISGFKVSPVLEMLLSLETLTYSWAPPRRVRETAEALGEDFLAELNGLYGLFHQGCSFTEVAVEYPDHEDVPGFLDWVEGLDAVDIVFYVMGRAFSREQIASSPGQDGIAALLSAHPEMEHLVTPYLDMSWADDPEALRDRVLGLWRRYWEGFFSSRVDGLRESWSRSIRDRERLMRSQGTAKLYAELTESESLPPLLPEGMPYDTLEFVPVCSWSASGAKVFFGWGRVTVIYACSMGEGAQKEIKRRAGESIKVLKALGDEKRLKLLRAIALHEKSVNGQWLARKLELSPSVVSRHLSQLKAAGLIEEFSPDNRAITYSLRMDTVRALSGELEAYLANAAPENPG